MHSFLKKATGNTLAPFGHINFRRMWVGNFLSNCGSAIQMTGAAWLMTTITSSSSKVALVQAAAALPIVLFSLAAGAIADNFHRRHVMLIAISFMFTISLLLTGFAYFGAIQPWQLLGFTFLIGCGTALNTPSWQASIGDIVPKQHIPAAVLLNGVGFNLSRSFAPAVGGFIIAAAGPVTTFAFNCVSYLGLFLFLFRWKPAKSEKALPRESIFPAMAAGIRYVAMSHNLRGVLFRAFLFSLSGIALLALLPLVTRHLIKGGPMDFGLLLASFGLGGVIGSFLMDRLRARFNNESVLRISFCVLAVACGIISHSRYLAITSASLILAGAFWIPGLSSFSIIVQLSAPRWVIGRALALFQTAANIGFVSGALLWGMAAQRFDTQTALILAGITLVAGAAYGLRYPLPEQKTLNLDPADSWKKPELSLDLSPTSGPIIIEIEYRIEEEDQPEFLDAMRNRRRIRLADGARQFRLTRNLHDPVTWCVSYQFPTWVDYLRHQERTTREDILLGTQIQALHSGPTSPIVRRMIERQPESALDIDS